MNNPLSGSAFKMHKKRIGMEPGLKPKDFEPCRLDHHPFWKKGRVILGDLRWQNKKQIGLTV